MRETILSSVRADPARARAHDRRNKRLGAEYAKAQSPRKRHRASENLVSSFFLSSSASSTGESTPPRSALISKIWCGSKTPRVFASHQDSSTCTTVRSPMLGRARSRLRCMSSSTTKTTVSKFNRVWRGRGYHAGVLRSFERSDARSGSRRLPLPMRETGHSSILGKAWREQRAVIDRLGNRRGRLVRIDARRSRRAQKEQGTVTQPAPRR
jgi:hypothetical protein